MKTIFSIALFLPAPCNYEANVHKKICNTKKIMYVCIVVV
jgi:hypothetical protein